MNEDRVRPFELAGERVSVRLAEPGDVDGIIQFFTANEAHLEPFGAAYARELLTQRHWLAQIEKRHIEFLHDDSCKTFIFGNDDGNPDVAQVNRTEEILKEYGKEYEFYRYDGAGQGFFAVDRPG